ncbi:MAG: FAD-binding oxidoreductase [Planctomycetaceae bacterium]|nr:FAD-binding oxidoreductase [Planctomycetaceae bacterium]
MRNVDVIVVGQGLAGTCLALELIRLSASVLVIDPAEPMTSSRIAAGLMTPVTGKRHVLAPDYFEWYAAAQQFYREFEKLASRQVLFLRDSLRAFQSPQERLEFEQNRMDLLPQLQGRLLEETDPLWGRVSAPYGGYLLPNVGQLDVAQFLDLAADLIARKAIRLVGQVDWSEVQFSEREVILPLEEVTARYVVACGGASDRLVPWFSHLGFLPAKGEILTLDNADWETESVIHGGIWIAPAPGRGLSVGSNYEWQQLDTIPTEAVRESILERMSRLIPDWNPQVLEHRAAVRPAMKDQRPVVGILPAQPRLAILNGLGSRGSLLAPWLSAQLAGLLIHAEPLDPRIKTPVS